MGLLWCNVGFAEIEKLQAGTTVNSLEDNDNQKRLIELKDIYEKGGISEAEYKAAKKTFSAKEDKSDKKLKKNKKSFSFKKKSKKNNRQFVFKIKS